MVRPSAKAALDESWLESANENIDENEKMKSLENMIDFLNANHLRKTVFSYILSRRFYEDDNLELRKIFEVIDKDKSGSIDENELFDYYGRHFPGTVEEEWAQIKELMKRADIDNSGKISYSEFLIVSNKINKTLNTTRIKEIFDHLDANKNGFIEVDDLKLVFGDASEGNMKYKTMIQEFDNNNDKKLSLQEFIDMLTKFY